MQPFTPTAVRLDPRDGLDALIGALAAEDYRVVGPVLRDGVVHYERVTGEADLPTGLSVEQAPGRWRSHVDGAHRFAWTPAADSWKRVVLPPQQEVLRIRRVDGTFVTTRPEVEAPVAMIGVRDCELRALAILDRVELDHEHPDPRYAARRDGAFVVAVTCSVPASTCWCTSIGGGPRPTADYDVRLTELDDADGHRLLAEAGSERGAAVLTRLAVGVSATDPSDAPAAERVVERAVAAMPRRLPGEDLPELLAGCDSDVHWDDVAGRCLSCGNCTMVCPTCFCSTFRDTTGLTDDGGPAEEVVRVQEWASCFQLDHSAIGGRPVRAEVADRYRQWLTHKLQHWHAQFGTAGCVGCGRCTTWCPAGIDLVAEAQHLLAARHSGVPS